MDEVIKTIGCAQDVQEENELMQLAHEHLPTLTKQRRIDFSFSEDDIFLKQFISHKWFYHSLKRKSWFYYLLRKSKLRF